MTDVLIADSSAGEVRTALVSDDRPVEVRLARGDSRLIGMIRLARVTDLAPETDSAFLDLGDGLNGFLPRKYTADSKARHIGNAVHIGQILVVELVTPPTESGKSWLIRADLRLKGRYVWLEPHRPGLRFASDFDDIKTKTRLEDALSPILTRCGVTVRLPAAGMDDDHVIAEAAQLLGQHRALAAAGGGPRVIIPPPGLLEQALCDAPARPDRIYLSDRALLADAKKLCQRWPDLLPLLTVWDGEGSLFATMGVEDALQQIGDGLIALPSGGSLLIEETRAATVIDVNSGTVATPRQADFVRRRTNEEAAGAIARLLRLANIGGLVLVDFIDIRKTSEKDALLAILDDALAKDPAPTRRSGLNAHGVLSITRKRHGLSLISQMLIRHGPTLRTDHQGHDLLRQAEREALKDSRPGVLYLKAGQRLAQWLELDDRLQRLQERTGRQVRLEVLPDDSDTDAECHIAP